ncbi:hypothetical protein BK126_26245 [Paenibacillus sp. FSL H7-0326]|nr:hypothetical protein BK126_26245 [Paenibacillus sp. FSL H7-0326]
MISDFERKVHRILYNYSGQRLRMPTMKELQTKTGHDGNKIKDALLNLEKQVLIAWEDKESLDSIVLLKGWEDESDLPRSVTATHTSTNYWTEY